MSVLRTGYTPTPSPMPQVVAREDATGGLLNHRTVGKIPGTDCELIEERDSSGRLTRLEAGGRVYLTEKDGWRHYDGGISMSEAMLPDKMLRSVQTAHGSWIEEYRLDRDGHPISVDGVEVRRDSRNRVVACGDWLYAYAGDDLTAITTPHGVRHVTRAADSRPVRVRSGQRGVEYHYDHQGRRIDVPPPPGNWNRDVLGRLWTVTRADGSVEATYLWDGFACLGRIDGAAGEPLDAVFSLDPTCTPVRVITRDRVTRIPRDAFGESLLDYPGVPGLFGGAQHEGYVYYAARALDPCIAAFTAPDPWNGLEDDPRRASGFRGTLLVEKGAYAVCLNDPVGRVDPTGEVSAGLIISTLTWSWQNNVLGWLAMDFFLNFWGSLFGAIGDGSRWDRFAGFEGLSSSDHIGAFGVRRDGIWAIEGGNRAWTFQHMVWASTEHLDELRDVQVFDPGAVFEPHHYGSILHVRPQANASFVLRGDGTTGNPRPGRPPNWTRAASRDADGRSTAVPVWEGSIVPRFPNSALHLDNPIAGLRGEIATTTAELVPAGGFAFGTIEVRALLSLATTGLGVNVGDMVFAGNGTGVISRVLSVEETGGTTFIRIEDDAADIPTSGARLRTIALQSEEDVPRGTAPEHLNVVNSSTAAALAPNDYDVGDFLRLSDGGTVLGSRRVARFEAQFAIDSAVPAALTTPLLIRTMTDTPGGNGTLTANPRQIRIATLPPAVGNAIAVTVGANVIPVFVDSQDTVDSQLFNVDRDLYTGPSQDGTAVTWQRLSNDAELTNNAPLPAGTTVTYTPTEIRRAPAAGFVMFDSTGGRTLRRVTARNYDSLVLDGAVPGTADPVHAERFTAVAGGVDQPIQAIAQAGALSVQPGQVLFAQDADTRRMVLHLVGTTMTALAAGTAFPLPTIAALPPPPAPTFAGATMTIPVPSRTRRNGRLAPSLPVVLDPGGAAAVELNVIRELRLTLRLDRPLNLAATTLRVARLEPGSPAYDATFVDGLRITALPFWTDATAAPPVQNRVQMPQFWRGEIVQVVFGAETRLYRIADVEGTTLTLTGDQPLTGATLAGTVTRMNPQDPGTGGAWAGIDGAIVAGGANDQLRVKVWRSDDLQLATQPPDPATGIPPAAPPLPIVVVDGATAHPAQIVEDDVTLEVVFVAAPAAASYDITTFNPAFSGYITEFSRQDDAYLVTNPPAAAATTPQNLVVAITYAEEDGNPPVDGELSPGTVRVPDLETFEVDRRQSLVDHELTHTIQSARWGPMMLCFLPYQLFMIDRAIELIPGVDAPQFSGYLPGTLTRHTTLYYLNVANAGGVTFEQGDTVEITLEHVAFMAELGAKEEDDFPLVVDNVTELMAGLPNDTPTQVRVRRNNTPGFWGHFGRNLLSALQLSTHGGVLNLVVGSTYGGLLTLLGRLIYAGWNAIFNSTQDYPAQVEQNGAVVRLTSDAGIAAFRGQARVTIKGEYAVIRAISAHEADGAVLRLVGNLPSTWTDVRVMLYSTQNPESPFDWHTYYPARVPDPTRPAEVQVTKIGSSPSLAFGDEVWLRNGTYTWPAKVLTATDQGATILLALSKPVAASVQPHEFLLAKVDAGSPGFDPTTGGTGAISALQDPMGFLSEDLMNLVGAGWMRWVFNPWGEGLTRLNAMIPEGDSFWWHLLRVLTHVARTSLNTYGWTLMPPAFGWLMWDREFTGGEHMSYTEQEASSASGDLYSPAGRLFGRFETDDEPSGVFDQDHFVYVGDVLRYVYYQQGRRTSTVRMGRQDRPGVWFNTNPRVMPNIAADPGRTVPDLLYGKDNANPYAFGDPAENNFFAAAHGWIPTSDRLERSSTIYATFTRPSGTGRHTVTVDQNTPNRGEGVEANDAGYQPLIFNVTVRDVTVQVAGQTVTNDATIQLVQGQQARLRITPTGGRNYSTTLLRPANGDVLRLGVNQIVARAQNGTEPVQINRTYPADALFTHLQRTLEIPVREFNITVVDTLPVLNTLPANADGVFAGLAQNPRPGDTVFVIVPCPIATGLDVDDATLGGLTAPSLAVETTPEALRDFVGDGAIYRITFAAGDTPAAPVDVVFRVSVSAETTIDLAATITVEPAP